jgi:hypothetical protein
MRRVWLALGVAAALVLPAVRARAGIDVEMAASFKAKSTLDPGETEVYRFHAEKGTLVTLSVAAAKGTDLVFSLALFDGVGDPVAIPAGVVKDLGKKVSWKGFVVPATDDYRLEVSATGSGAYAISFAKKAQAKWPGTLVFPDSTPLDHPFSAPAGSTVSVAAKTHKGTAAAPALVSAQGPGLDLDLTSAGKKTATSHAAPLGVLAQGGDFTVTVGNGGAAGSIDVTVVVKPPKAKPAKLDLRGVSLGHPSGGETLVVRTVGAAGGTVTVDDAASDLLNASVTIPPGVLAGNTPISVGSTVDPPLGTQAVQAAGPAVDLQPSGLVFSSPVTVVLPFDFTRIPAGSTAADITIRIVEEDGSAQVVPPDSVDEAGGTVTVLTNGFSVCIPVIPPGPPVFGYNSNGTVKPGGDEFWFLGLRAQFGTDFSANDSRNRQVELEEGQVSLYSDGTLQVASQKTQLQWSNSDTGPGQVDGTITTTVTSNGDSVGWVYGADGQTIEITGGGSEYPIFAVSRDGSVVSSRTNDGTFPETENIFGIRKPTQTPTLALLAGSYQGVGFEIKSSGQSPGAPADLHFRRIFGTMTLGADGSARVGFSQRKAEFDTGTGQWSSSLENGSITAPAGSAVVEAQGTVLVTFPFQNGDTVDPVRIYPGRDFKGGFFTNGTPKSADFLAFIFTREGSGMGNSVLNGTYRGGLFDPDVQQYGVSSPNVNVPDFEVQGEGVTATLTGGATGTLAFHDHKVRRDNGTTGGVAVTEEDSSTPVSVSVTSKGKVTFATPDGAGVGSIAPDGSYLVLGSDITNPGQDFFIGVCVRSPPHN